MDDCGHFFHAMTSGPKDLMASSRLCLLSVKTASVVMLLSCSMMLMPEISFFRKQYSMKLSQESLLNCRIFILFYGRDWDEYFNFSNEVGSISVIH